MQGRHDRVEPNRNQMKIKEIPIPNKNRYVEKLWSLNLWLMFALCCTLPVSAQKATTKKQLTWFETAPEQS